jgi:hypothetical protein
LLVACVLVALAGLVGFVSWSGAPRGAGRDALSGGEGPVERPAAVDATIVELQGLAGPAERAQVGALVAERVSLDPPPSSVTPPHAAWWSSHRSNLEVRYLPIRGSDGIAFHARDGAHGNRGFKNSFRLGEQTWSSLRKLPESEVIRLNPHLDVPIGVPLELTVIWEGEPPSWNDESVTLTWRAVVPVTLPESGVLDLGPVALECITPWLVGRFVPAPETSLVDARAEVMEHAFATVADEPFAAAASVALAADGGFEFKAPHLDGTRYLRLRLVLADGTKFERSEPLPAFSKGWEIRASEEFTVVGRLAVEGASASGLATVHAERAGMRIGTSTVRSDGSFKLTNLTPGAFDVVFSSTRPGGEVHRRSEQSLPAADAARRIDVGTVELGSYGALVELELLDARSRPTSAMLRWRSASGAGGANLAAAPLHRMLLPHGAALTLEVERRGGLGPLPLVDPHGRITVLVEP